MQNNIKNILGVSLAVSSLVFAFSAFFLVSGFLQSKEPVRTFSVSAEGEIVAIPDIVEFDYAVITEGGENLTSLKAENVTKSNRINSYLKERGIAEEDLKTIGYNVSPRYRHFPCPIGQRVCPPSEIVGYTITHSVRVKVRDLAKVGELLSGVIMAGANSTSGLTFSIDDLEAIQNQARDIAIQKARDKAKDIANSAGVGLGKIVSINENFQAPFKFREVASEALLAAPDQAFAPPVIEPGSQEVKVIVNIVFEIR